METGDIIMRTDKVQKASHISPTKISVKFDSFFDDCDFLSFTQSVDCGGSHHHLLLPIFLSSKI